MFKSKRIYLKLRNDDSCYFGTSVVINNKYIAVGDPGANRVVIYQRNRLNQWRRVREILPPHNSVPFEVGNGFGQELELDNNILVIEALTSQRTKDITNPEYFQKRSTLNSTFFGRYLTRIDRETEVRQIGLKAERGLGCVHFNLLSEGKIKSITLSDRREHGFGVSSALYKNLLLVGSPSYRTGGGAWLFNLENLESDPEKISDSGLFIGETVAIILCIVLQAKVSMSNPNQICFQPESGDSAFFATSVAINDKYLAVGDTGANRVIIYTSDGSGQWLRTREILPPADSIPDKVGQGFGRDLQLDGDVLAIGALTQQRTSEVTNPEDFQPIITHYTPYVLTFEGRYLTRLDSETEVKTISLPIEKQSGFVKFNLLIEGKIKQVLLVDNGEEEFGFAMAVYNGSIPFWKKN